jgi:hypothetical protein
MTLPTLLFIIVFFIGLYFYAKCSDPKYHEGLTNNAGGIRCPNLLIQKGSRFYLYNSKIAKVPGVNPVEFENLEDYTEFLDWQRSQGIRCPVLYLQHSYDAQGNAVYKVRPSVSEPQGGLPPSSSSMSVSTPGSTIASTPSSQGNTAASIGSSVGNLITEQEANKIVAVPPNPTLLVDATRNDPPYNKNSYPAFDQTSFYVGTTTPLDKINAKEENMLYSPNPMDENWGGAAFTQSLIDKGYYKDNEVSIRV